jgi:hypothetical protein
MERTAKSVWCEAHETALKRGLSDLDAARHASQVTLSYADRMVNASVERHDDEKADRKLWGNGR